MANPVGFRFRPTDEEIVDIYLRPKNLQSNTSHVDEVISTVDICSFDPWNLPSQSRMKTNDQVWYFFGRKENKYGRGDRQIRKTKSGFWKKTGVTMDIMRKRGDREKIGEKRVLVFKNHGGSSSGWVMHEYHATFLSPNQMVMAYTLCKVKFKGERREFSVASGSGIEHTRSLIPHTNNSRGLSVETEGSSFHSQESQNRSQFTGFLDVDALDSAFHNILSDDFKVLLDDDEQSKIVSMQDDRNNYIPQKPLTGVFIDHSSDDSDSDPISATTISVPTSSNCDSLGSSNHLVDQIKTQQSPDSTTTKLVSLTQEVSKALGTSIDTSEKKKKNPYDDAQGTEIGEHHLGQEAIKNKRAGFFYRMTQKFVKKIHLCSSTSRT